MKKRSRRKLKPGYSYRENGTLMLRFIYENERYCVYGVTESECEKKKYQKIKQIEEGKIVHKKRINSSEITVSQYYAEWRHNRIGTVKESTLYANETKWKRLKPLIGECKVVDIDTRDVKAIQKQLASYLSSTGVNDTMIMLSEMFKSAVVDGIIEKNPCYGIKPIKRTEPTAAETNHRALTKDEQELFFRYAKGTWQYEYLAMLVLTGMRAGELSALTWNDIDEDSGIIHVTKTVTRISDKEYKIDSPKTRHSKRDIPITDAMAELLRSQQEKNMTIRKESDFVFLSPTGEMVSRNNVNIAIKALLKKIQTETGIVIEHFSLHALRATFATRAIEQGMKPEVLKSIMGHSKISITLDLYTHVLADTRLEAMHKLKIAI